MSEFNGMITLTQLLETEPEQGRGIESIKTFYAISLNGEGPPQGGSIVAIIDKENLQLKDEDGEIILDINTENKLEILLDKFFFIEGETLRILEKIWTESIPAGNLQGYYIWSRMLITYTDGDQQEIFSVNYMGHDGEAISKTKIFYALSDDIQEVPSENTWVSKVPDNLQGGKYLWTITRIYYSNGSYIDNYSIAYQGKDGGSEFVIQSNQEEIFKFKTSQGYEYSPEVLTFKVFQGLDFNNKHIELNYEDFNLEIIDINQTIEKNTKYLSLGQFVDFGENEDRGDINTVYFNIKNYLNDNNIDSSYSIFRFSYIKEGKVSAVKILELKNGVSDDMAKFGVYANNVTASIQSNKLVFDANGLTIQKKVEQNYEKVFWANEAGDLFLKGNIEATGGTFSGQLIAASGSFEGKISAESGTIGGLTISHDAIYQGDNYLNSPLKINGDGSIYSENITLGQNAKIENYIQLGGAYIKNPDNNGGIFLEANKFSLNQNGILKLGSIEANGGNEEYDSYIKAGLEEDLATWKINGNGTASFREITVDKATIKNSILEVGTVQAVGSLMLFKDSWKIESINNNVITLINNIEVINLANGDILTDGNSYYTVINVSGVKVTLNSIGSLQAGQVLTKVGQHNEEKPDFLISILGDGTEDKAYAKKNSLTISEVASVFEGVPIFKTKLVLGDLSSLQELGASGTGLFAENVFLNGTLTTKLGTNQYAGVNTLNGAIANKFGDDDKSKIVFWAGSNSNSNEDIEKAPFQVTENGSIYANKGIFEGSLITKSVIKGAEIYTAKIYGENIYGDQAALQIFDANRGIEFIKNSSNENDYQLRIGTEGFYNKSFSALEPFIGLSENEGVVYRGNKLLVSTKDKTNRVLVAPDHIGYIADESEEALQKILMDSQFSFIFNESEVFQIKKDLIKGAQKANFQQNVIFGIENQSDSGVLEYQKVNSGYNLFVR